MKNDGAYEILLLCGPYDGMADTVQRHVKKLTEKSHYNIIEYQMLGTIDEDFDLGRFDGLIIHYTLLMASPAYLNSQAKKKIRNFKGLKLAFIQDEYRHINATVSALADMRIDVLFSVCDSEAISKIYSDARLANLRKETTLTGYVPKDLLSRRVKRLAERPIDVGYRARDLSGQFAWLGYFASEKGLIGKRFAEDAKAYDLRCDISGKESDRIYGKAWFDFMANCKATLGTESGASVGDFTGDIQRSVEAYWQKSPEASFSELREKFFAKEDGKTLIATISPRSFEAAALRTLMILYPGNYSGILKPWRHYVPLKRDHSNMDEVVAVLRDPQKSQALTDCAYEEIACNPKYHYTELVQHFDRVFREEFSARAKKRVTAKLKGRNYMREYERAHKWRSLSTRLFARLRMHLINSAAVHARATRFVIGASKRFTIRRPKINWNNIIYQCKVIILRLPFAWPAKRLYDRKIRKRQN